MKQEEIKQRIKETLIKREEIEICYIYGSFLTQKYYSDIDVGLVIKKEFVPNALYEAYLSRELELALKNLTKNFIPIDVRILNKRSLNFLYSMLKNSELLFVREDLKKVKFESAIIKKYLDIEPHYKMYNKMRRLRYID